MAGWRRRATWQSMIVALLAMTLACGHAAVRAASSPEIGTSRATSAPSVAATKASRPGVTSTHCPALHRNAPPTAQCGSGGVHLAAAGRSHVLVHVSPQPQSGSTSPTCSSLPGVDPGTLRAACTAERASGRAATGAAGTVRAGAEAEPVPGSGASPPPAVATQPTHAPASSTSSDNAPALPPPAPSASGTIRPPVLPAVTRSGSATAGRATTASSVTQQGITFGPCPTVLGKPSSSPNARCGFKGTPPTTLAPVGSAALPKGITFVPCPTVPGKVASSPNARCGFPGTPPTTFAPVGSAALPKGVTFIPCPTVPGKANSSPNALCGFTGTPPTTFAPVGSAASPQVPMEPCPSLPGKPSSPGALCGGFSAGGAQVPKTTPPVG